jgi:hypothetical protein
MQDMLVVELAVQPSPANVTSDAFLPTSQPQIGMQGEHIDLTMEDMDETVSDKEVDSDIEIVKSTLTTGEVIDTYRPPQRTKRPLSKSGSTDGSAPKKLRAAGPRAKPHPKQPLSVSSATQNTPVPSGHRISHPALHATTRSPSTPQSNPTSNSGSKNSPQEMYRLKLNTLASALVALRAIVAALRLVKGRKEMAKRATLARLVDFVCESRSLARMLQGSPSGLESSPLPEANWASQPNGPEEAGGESQKLEMVEEGRDFCKLTWDLLNDPRGKHKAKFCTDSSLVFLNLFKERCYGVWATVEEACVSLGKRKQNRW